MELVYNEFVVREELGQQPSPDEWYARFPLLRTRLERMFRVHAEIMRGIGARPTPDVETLLLAAAQSLDDRSPEMPTELLVIGSGAIGIEFASFYNDLGAKVTVVEMLDRVVPVEDSEVSEIGRAHV